MRHIFTKYKLQYVKEETGLYEVSKTIKNTKDIYNILRDIIKLNEEAEEVLFLIVLNTKNSVTGFFEVSRGNISSSIVHPREILKRVILLNGVSFILAHNHPSGDPKASSVDIEMTKNIKYASNLMNINFLDHIIVGDNDFESMKGKGVL